MDVASRPSSCHTEEGGWVGAIRASSCQSNVKGLRGLAKQVAVTTSREGGPVGKEVVRKGREAEEP